jgi:hypothetical protein
MPHVVLNGKITAKEVFNVLEEIFVKESQGILKTTNQFLDKEEQIILLESLVIEQGQKTAFLTMINNREDGVVIRIYPGFDDFEKTDGVKQLLAEIAKQLLAKISEVTVGKTNLQEYLQRE